MINILSLSARRGSDSVASHAINPLRSTIDPQIEISRDVASETY